MGDRATAGVQTPRESFRWARLYHSALLRNQEFAGAIIRKHWNDSDVLYQVDNYGKAMDELVRLIDLELANTS